MAGYKQIVFWRSHIELRSKVSTIPTHSINLLLLLFAIASPGHLTRKIQYLKAENEVLRVRLPEHFRTTLTERAKPLKFGKLLGAFIQDVITVVHPRTFAR